MIWFSIILISNLSCTKNIYLCLFCLEGWSFSIVSYARLFYSQIWYSKRSSRQKRYKRNQTRIMFVLYRTCILHSISYYVTKVIHFFSFLYKFISKRAPPRNFHRDCCQVNVSNINKVCLCACPIARSLFHWPNICPRFKIDMFVLKYILLYYT